jgi:hypothetical protein
MEKITSCMDGMGNNIRRRIDVMSIRLVLFLGYMRIGSVAHLRVVLREDMCHTCRLATLAT